MVAKAQTKYLRISPKKLRQVISLVKGKQALKAQDMLKCISKKASGFLGKTLTSAISNAKNKGYKEDKLFISKLIANPGPVLKRWRAASFGRATTIRKRTSHILIELDTSERLIGEVKIK